MNVFSSPCSHCHFNSVLKYRKENPSENTRYIYVTHNSQPSGNVWMLLSRKLRCSRVQWRSINNCTRCTMKIKYRKHQMDCFQCVQFSCSTINKSGKNNTNRSRHCLALYEPEQPNGFLPNFPE